MDKFFIIKFIREKYINNCPYPRKNLKSIHKYINMILRENFDILSRFYDKKAKIWGKNK